MGLKALQALVAQDQNRFRMWLVKQKIQGGQTRRPLARDDPLSRFERRPFAQVRQRQPECGSSMSRPKSPTIILLDWVGERESMLFQRRDHILQPGREILAEAAWIDE